jgi:bifunctional N-acetylglucosamine-1-phosphate-uridyltransferase/glucosamine-1-phosphate-acetyltransferase GlmU-like protein
MENTKEKFVVYTEATTFNHAQDQDEYLVTDIIQICQNEEDASNLVKWLTGIQQRYDYCYCSQTEFDTLYRKTMQKI